eukprot:2219972-Amphidinium_carterae.1
MESREHVLEAVKVHWTAFEYVGKVWTSDHEVGDREIVLAAVQQNRNALLYAADELLEDPTFAPERKTRHYLLKLTMLSGRSAVVAACIYWNESSVLAMCRRRHGLPDDGARIELWHGSGERVPDDERVPDWPGIQPLGEISEYQLLVTR